MQSLEFGTRLKASTMKVGMLVVVDGKDADMLDISGTVGVIHQLAPSHPIYKCIVISMRTKDGTPTDSNQFYLRPSELLYFGMFNKFCLSPIFDRRLKATAKELTG